MRSDGSTPTSRGSSSPGLRSSTPCCWPSWSSWGGETLNSAHATTYTEADQLSNIYWIARSLPAPQGPAIEDLALKYAHTVVDREWPLMNEGKTSPEAQDLLTQIR